MLSVEKRILVTGGFGMVGTAIYKTLIQAGHTDVLRPSSKELDLRQQVSTEAYFKKNKPDVVIMAAAKVGGIQENVLHPAEFMTDNALIEINTIKSAYLCGVSKLIMICSSSIYPSRLEEPSESDLLNGGLDGSNEGYALAKLFGVQLCKMYRKQYGVDYCCIIPCNLYGPYDRFIGDSAHVVPAMISRFQHAVEVHEKEIVIWGSGRAMREFMYVDDLARCCYGLLNLDEPLPLNINIGSGDHIRIHRLAEMISEITGYKGCIRYDPDKPEGQLVRKMDLGLMRSLGLKAVTPMKEGLQETYKFFLENRERLR